MIVQLICAFLGSLGFSLLFGLRWRYVFLSSFGGCLCWGLYLLAAELGAGVFLANLAAAAFSAVYAEILARIMKAPAPLFCIPTLIPLVPGSTLYYTMSSVVQGNMDAAGAFGWETLQAGLAIAAGISLIWSVFFMTDRVLSKK